MSISNFLKSPILTGVIFLSCSVAFTNAAAKSEPADPRASLAAPAPFAALASVLAPASQASASLRNPAAEAAYGRLPLHFEPNMGQMDARVRFVARGGGMTAFFTGTETVMVLGGREEQAAVRMTLERSAKPRSAAGADQLPSFSNYFIGNDASKWRTNVPHFARIEIEQVYPGVDVVWYGNERQLEYDFIVAPGADSSRIQIAYSGVESMKVQPNGDLILRTAAGELRQPKPLVYQEIGGKRIEVAARYTIDTRRRVGFELAKYDRSREVRIDPVMVYSTYLGGSGADDGKGIAVDSAGSAYITGYTLSSSFPLQSAYQSQFRAPSDAFVAKLTPAGTGLVYSTYFGGSAGDQGSAIKVDSTGAAYVAGYTQSGNFPTMNPYQSGPQGKWDAFVTKLNAAGNGLVYSTYLGGNDEDGAYSIAIDSAGAAYVTGSTQSTNFPLSSPYQSTIRGGLEAFVTKLAPNGATLVYSTYLGGAGLEFPAAIAVDASGSAYVAGYTRSTNFPIQAPYQSNLQGIQDAFLTKFNPAGTQLVYSTFLGGSNYEYATGIAVDSSGAAYLTGSTNSTNFPTRSPLQPSYAGGGVLTGDAFVTKFNPQGSDLSYSTYLGGSLDDEGLAIAVDASGSAIVSGRTLSTNFPTQQPTQGAHRGGSDSFVAKLQPAGAPLLFSTYLGGSGQDQANGIAVDGLGAAYVIGSTGSNNFPVQSAILASAQGDIDAFVTKIAITDAPVGLRFVPVTPCRIADTRNAPGPFGGPIISAGGARSFDIPASPCGVPRTAAAYSLNVTVVPTGPLGYLTVWPTGQGQPEASTLNSHDGRIKANAAIVAAGTGNAISVFVTEAAHVVLDINGYFVPATDPAALAFYPVAPCRLVDTRTPNGAFGSPSLVAGGTRTFPILSSSCNVPASAQAYSLNMTVVPKGPLSYLTTWPTGVAQPTVSTLNAPTGVITANAAIVPAGTGGSINTFVTEATDLVIDINGYFAPPAFNGLSLFATSPCRVLDTRLPSGSPTRTGRIDVPVSASSCAVPGAAQAYVFNGTVVPPSPLGYLTLWPGGAAEMPVVSTLNAPDSRVTSNMAIVPAGNGAISAFLSNASHLILDTFGYFAP